MKTTKRKRGSAAAPAERKVKAAPRKPAASDVQAQSAPVADAMPMSDVVCTPPAARPSASIVLASNCSVKDAAALKSSLCRLADENGEVTVDAGNVERVDTSTMQLLCAFVWERAAQGRKVVWAGNSQVLQEAARLLGVQKLLALPETEFKGAAA